MSIRWQRAILLVVSSLFIASAAAAQTADLFVTKTSPATASEGSNVTYTVDVGNAGPDAAVNFTLTDTLPAGGTFVSESQPSGPMFNCTTPSVGAAGGTVTCTIASLASGATAEFSIVVNAPKGTAGTTLINSATVKSDTADDNTENNTAISGTTITGGDLADIGVNKTGPASAVPGSNVTFTITISNFGPNDSGKVTLNDTLGAGFTFVSLNQTNGPSFTCTAGPTTPCSIASLPNGSSATFQLVATISSTPGTYTNTASVTSPNDPNAENDSSDAAVIASSSDVGVSKSAPASAVAGAAFTYTVTLSNSGPDTADTASFNDALPAGILFVSISQSLPAGSTGNCATPGLDQNGTVTCSVSPLLNGASATYTITVEADPSTANGTIVNNTAVASSDTPDANPNNNSSSAMTTISTNADVAVLKTGPASVTAGNNITYTITVTNNGPSTASTVSMTDTLPAGETFVSLTQTSGPSFNCTTGATVTCTDATLLANASATFQLVAKVSSSATGTISNTASVLSTTPDSSTGNNSSSSNATVSTSADVGVMKTGLTGALAGSPITYTITASNTGPSDAQSVSLTDTFPPGATVNSFSQSSGPSFTCGPASGASVTCTLASFAAGASATFSLTLTMPPATPTGTMITNSVTISSATSDPNTANNTATATTTISGAPDLSVMKTAPATVAAGATFSYTIVVANTGASAAPNTTFTDALPAGVTFNSLGQSSPLLTCSTPTPGTNGTISCTSPSFASGASDTLTVSVTASPTLATGTTISNTATVNSTATDLNTANNTSTATTTVNPGNADLAITKTGPTNPVTTGSPVTFTINVTNNGPSTANNVVVTDTLPTGVTFTSATPSQGTCSGTTTVVCSLGTLANGAGATITIQAMAGAPGGNTANTATVTSANPDSNLSNNSATSAAFNVANFNNVPAASPLMLMLLALMLAAGGAIVLRR